jgi:hypothetical protein
MATTTNTPQPNEASARRITPSIHVGEDEDNSITTKKPPTKRRKIYKLTRGDNHLPANELVALLEKMSRELLKPYLMQIKAVVNEVEDPGFVLTCPTGTSKNGLILAKDNSYANNDGCSTRKGNLILAAQLPTTTPLLEPLGVDKEEEAGASLDPNNEWELDDDTTPDDGIGTIDVETFNEEHVEETSSTSLLKMADNTPLNDSDWDQVRCDCCLFVVVQRHCRKTLLLPVVLTKISFFFFLIPFTGTLQVERILKRRTDNNN